MECTKGKLHRHGLAIDIRKADGDHTRLANMSESSTAYLPVYEKQAANANELVRRWNAFEDGGLVSELKVACEVGLDSMRGMLEMGVKIGASNKNKRDHKEHIKFVTTAIAKAQPKPGPKKLQPTEDIKSGSAKDTKEG